jgi:hypothetical protein
MGTVNKKANYLNIMLNKSSDLRIISKYTIIPLLLIDINYMSYENK